MKKTSFILAFCLTLLISSIVTAQTEKGKILVGADSNMNFSALTNKGKSDLYESDNYKTSNFTFSPKIGYFVANNLSLGVEVPFSFSKFKSSSIRVNDLYYSSQYFNQEDKNTSITFAPFVKYYFNANKTIKPFLQGQIGLGVSKFTTNRNYYVNNFDPTIESYNSTSKSNLFMYGVDGGLAIFFNDKISLDIALGYASTTFKRKEDNPYNYKEITSGFVSNIGFSLYF